MKPLDIDAHIRQMERASTTELESLTQELSAYLNDGSVAEQQARKTAYKQAIKRLIERSETELALVKQLIDETHAA